MLLCAVILILVGVQVNPTAAESFLEFELLGEGYVDETGRFIASILKPICNSYNIYQLNFIQLFFDPYSNVVMNRVLKYISGTSCGNKIVVDYTLQKMGSTSGTQYYIVFCNVLRQNVDTLMNFVLDREILHGDARYIFVTFLNNGVPYKSEYFLQNADRFRLHYIFMIKYDAYGWCTASFFDPFTIRERPYKAGQDIEQTFKDQLRNVHGYKFSFQYSRQTHSSLNEIGQYWYFVYTMARARGGTAVFLPPSHEQGDFPDFMLIEDIYFDASSMKYVKLLPMNQFRYLCVVTPTLNKEIPWLSVFIDPFHWTVWTTFLVVVELLSVFIFRFGYQAFIRRGLLTIHFEIYQTFINGPPERRRTQLEEFVIGMFVLLCMILMAVYESALVSSMSLKRFYPEIDTIDEVNNSKYPVVIIKHVSEQFSLNFKQIRYFDNSTRIGNFSLFKLTDYQHVVPCETVPAYVKGNADGQMRRVAEHAGSKTNNFGIATFSPYGEILYHYWNLFVEGDLFKYWQLIKFIPKYFDRSGGHLVRPLGLKDMNIAWFVILVGSLMGFTGYIAELCYSCIARIFFS